MATKTKTKVTDIITNVFSLLGVSADSLTISDEDGMFQVQLNLPDTESGVFIGHQGETLASLQLLLSLVVSQRLGDWHRVKINVGDYQQRREQQLLTKADLAAQRALETGQEIILPNLNSYERHLIHEHLSQNSSVSTTSRGEEPNRQLFVSPAK